MLAHVGKMTTLYEASGMYRLSELVMSPVMVS